MPLQVPTVAKDRCGHFSLLGNFMPVFSCGPVPVAAAVIDVRDELVVHRVVHSNDSVTNLEALRVVGTGPTRERIDSCTKFVD